MSSFSGFSDEKLKYDVNPISDSLGKILNLIPVEYDWTDEGLESGVIHGAYGKHDIGFVAQNAKKVLPTLVNTNDDGYLIMSYSRVVPLIIESIKEEQKNIDMLEEEINKLRLNNK